jgi:Flp pilus assembly pilin Flp
VTVVIRPPPRDSEAREEDASSPVPLRAAPVRHSPEVDSPFIALTCVAHSRRVALKMHRIARWMRSDDHAKRLVLGSIAALISVGLVVGLSVLVVEYAPQRLVSTEELHGTDRAEEVGRTRTALLAFLAGVIATAGAIFTALSYRLSKRGQITERFTKAIDQLGSTSLDLQLGGIYALERIARDSKANHGPVIKVLTAYVRKRAPWPPTERPPERNGQRAASADDDGNTGQDPKPATDIQADNRASRRSGHLACRARSP